MDNLIFCYTWDNAIDDGTFVKVDDKLRREAGIKHPTAITNNLYCSHIKSHDSTDETGRLWDLLHMFTYSIRAGKADGNRCAFKVKFGNELVTVIGVCEARGPDNPEPVITFMLPEDD